MPSFSIIICTYNRANYLKETIDSVLSTFSDKANFELLVIDNNSTDHTSQLMSAYKGNPWVHYFLEKNQGLSNARNRGIREARYEVLIFLDDDVDLDKDYENYCKKLFNDPAIHIAGGKVLPYNSAVPAWLPKQYYYIISIFDIGNEPILTDKLMGANYAMRREVAHKTGWYNPELGRKGANLMGGEEVDYLNRARQLGYQVLYHPHLVVYHKIENKLNQNYVYNYSLNLGRSEYIIDAQNSKLKTAIKLVKAVVMIALFYLYGFYAPSPKQKTYFTINQQYSIGYLKAFFKTT